MRLLSVTRRTVDMRGAVRLSVAKGMKGDHLQDLG